MALRPSSEPPQEAPAAAQRVDSNPSPRAGIEPKAPDGNADVQKDTRARELRELRAREQAARDQLALARQRVADLEKELNDAPPASPKRTRREFDLTPEDWRQMASDGVMKYRLPCEGPPPGNDVLDDLGIAPDDRDVTRQAFEHSATRLRSAILPLCAAALGERTELALEMSTESCRQVILGTASDRAESKVGSVKSVASYMAGDAPRPAENSSITERMFLVLAEESKHIEEELAEAFGPEEAHRLIFSDRLCFTTATHNYDRGPR
jgi:hypothetical protein